MRKIVRRPARPGSTQFEAETPRSEPQAEEAVGWAEGEILLPRSKRLVSLRIDADVLEYFQASGKGYQTRMNAVLRAFMDARKRRG